MTASELVTTATFRMAKLIKALCHSSFIVEQQSRVAPGAPEDRLETSAFPRAHAHLLDDEIAWLRLETGDRRLAPTAASDRKSLSLRF